MMVRVACLKLSENADNITQSTKSMSAPGTSESLKKTNVSAQFTKSNHDMQRLEVEMQTGSYSLDFSLADLT